MQYVCVSWQPAGLETYTSVGGQIGDDMDISAKQGSLAIPRYPDRCITSTVQLEKLPFLSIHGAHENTTITIDQG